MNHLAVILCVLCVISGASAAAEAAQKPNFILILADDLGYGDLACYGAKDIATPHIDQMAREGAKFTSCYVAPVCSPTRASLMTGCIAQRVGIGGVLFPRNNHGLNPDEMTLPELLKAQGYATAIVGKWHLGNQDLFQPLKHGFDTWYGTPASNSQGFDPSLKQFAPDCTWRGVHTRESLLKLKEAPCPLVRDNVVIEVPADQSRFTQRYTREAIRFITENKGKPFFLYLPHNMPHIPLHASEKFVGSSKRGLYGDTIQELDWSTGEILKALKELGIAKTTLVIFMSDNGPNTATGGSAGPLKGSKGSTLEGGVRVPFVARWPGKIPPETVSDAAITIMDLLPTLTRLAGGEVPTDRVIDGKDIWPIIGALLTTNALAMDIPKRVQQKILAAAPEIDQNGDGQITVDELKAGSDKLPEDIRAVLDLYLDTQGEPTKESEPTKRKTTLPKPPAGNGATPFIDPMFEYKKTENITYGAAKSGDTTMPLLLDVYQPAATDKLPKKLPAMVMAFGGGWTKGSKDLKYIRDLCGYYAARGYVAISIQYRIAKDNPPALPGPAPSPEKNEQFRLINAAFQDTCNAVRWVRTNADKYDIAPNRIGIGGVSAGAFNALNTGFCDDKLTGPDAEVAAVISLMGAIGASHIDKNDPPVFIAHGTSDNLVPYAMVKGMVRRLDEVGAKYSFYPVDGVAHRLESILDTQFDGKSVRDHSLDFCFEAMKLGELIKKAP